jgi:nicotinamide-nucleotide amidase
VQRVLEGVPVPERRVLRFYGASESTVARTLAEAGGEGGGLTATICARDFEIHVDLFAGPDSRTRLDSLADELAGHLGQHLFARDERPVEELVLDLCRDQGLGLAVAESCTGGLVAARLTSVAGSSDVFRGGIVAYANEVKAAELGVGEELLERHGAVSREAAAAMADTPGALQLRLLETIVSVAAEKNSTLVLPFPVELLRFLERNSGPGAATQVAADQPRSPAAPVTANGSAELLSAVAAVIPVQGPGTPDNPVARQ